MLTTIFSIGQRQRGRRGDFDYKFGVSLHPRLLIKLQICLRQGASYQRAQQFLLEVESELASAHGHSLQHPRVLAGRGWISFMKTRRRSMMRERAKLCGTGITVIALFSIVLQHAT